MAGPLTGVAMALFAGGVAELDGGSSVAASEESQNVAAAVDELLGQLVIAVESDAPYDRRRFRDWIDADRDGCDTRREVLIAERTRGQIDDCRVIGGRWFSMYDGEVVTDPNLLQIDHLVALGEAWDSGADVWDDARRGRYSNDLGYRNALIAVTVRSNSQKSDHDPTDWVPTRRASWCRYATAWTTVKIRWQLTADPEEVVALRRLFATCRTNPPTAVTLAL